MYSNLHTGFELAMSIFVEVFQPLHWLGSQGLLLLLFQFHVLILLEQHVHYSPIRLTE